MRRIRPLALVLALLAAAPAWVRPAAAQRLGDGGQEDDWGFYQQDDAWWPLGDDRIREDYGWDDAWGEDDAWARDDRSAGPPRHWNVDDPGFEAWYGEPTDVLEFDRNVP